MTRMDNDGEGNPGDSLSSPGPNARDGLIDFADYSLAQLQELQHGVDPASFPRNYSNLLAEIGRREKQIIPQSASASVFAGRFTSYDGMRGWLQSKGRRYPMYGAGSIEVGRTDVVLRGWQRTWLAVPLQSEVSIPIDTIRNCIQDDACVRFEYKRRFRRIRRVEFLLETAQQSGMLAARLPKVYLAGFEKRWPEIQQFNARLRTITPRVWITPAIVAANTAVFIAMAVAAKRPGAFDATQLLNWGANYGPLTVNGQWWRLITALFVHLNLAHLLLNMWAFWNVGRLTERMFGQRVFFALYFASGAIASLTSIAWDPTHSSVGASGAIFGIFGAFLAFLSHRHTLVPAAIVRAHWPSTVAFVLFNLANGALQPGIDNAAHVGGLVSGFIAGWILARPLDVEHRRHLSFDRILVAIVFIAVIGLAEARQARGVGSQLTIPEQYFRAHEWYANGEAGNLRLWQQLAALSSAGTISDAELGQRFQSEILPFWQSASERLQTENQSIQGEQRQFALLVADFARLRLEWVRALIDATEHNDTARAHEALDLAKNTDLAQARIERLAIRANMDHRARALAHSPLVVRIKSLLSAGRGTCIMAPPTDATPVAATDAKADGPAMRQAAGCLAQRLFMTGHYGSLDSMMKRSAASVADLPDGGSTYAGLIGGLSDLFEYGRLDAIEALGRTSDWRRAVKDSVEPDLVEAMIFQAWAWSVRGHGYANSVSAQAWAVFAHRTEMAAATLKETSDRASSSPLWYQLSLGVGLDQSLSADDLHAIFDRGVARFPEYLPLYQGMLRISMPRWLGSYDKVDQLITDSSAKSSAPDETYARLYWVYSSLERDEINIFSDAQAKWPMMKRGLREMMNHYPKSNIVLNAFEKFACIAGDSDEYKAARSGIETHLAASAWSDRVSLKSCDRKISEQAARSLIDLGNTLLDRHDYDHAIADFDKAIASDPKAAMAFADRGMAYLWKRNDRQASKDFDAAVAIDPTNAVVFRGRGMLALQASHANEAIAAFSRSLELEPANVFTLEKRARAYAQAGDVAKALVDSAEVLRQRPTFVDMYWFRGLMFRKSGNAEKAMAEAAALIAANPGDPHAYSVAGAIYASVKKYPDAMRVFAQALKMSPTDGIYLARARYRPSTDIAGKQADIDTALKLNPNSVSAMVMRAQMQSNAGRFPAAIATLSAAIQIQSSSYSLLAARGIAYAKSGQEKQADADFNGARAYATNVYALNDLCWSIATAGVALATALTECDAAVARAPGEATFLDSRGFVLLRLAKYDEAIAAYDSALSIRPATATSLYGRGIARRRNGDVVAGDADIKAALAADADIGATFTGFGVTP
jgi:membrane associated rhomboid family serine protease/tetratricopeptide (TPR) repeat protein